MPFRFLIHFGSQFCASKSEQNLTKMELSQNHTVINVDHYKEPSDGDVLARLARLESRDAEIQSRDAEIQSCHVEIERLNQRIATLEKIIQQPRSTETNEIGGSASNSSASNPAFEGGHDPDPTVPNNAGRWYFEPICILLLVKNTLFCRIHTWDWRKLQISRSMARL